MRSSTLKRHAQPLFRRPVVPVISSRRVHISPSPAASTGDEIAPRSFAVDASAPDAQFEVLGSPHSLLSASLAASQTLYTRRGTLVGVSGKAENAVSSLTPLSPITRVPLGIPFLYQKITSASPITCLISTRSPITSFTTVHLDGTTDWMVAQSKGLLAWTGQTLTLTPSANLGLSLSQWGQTRVTGRGLLALAGAGQVYQVHIGAGEEYTAHPANVLAYSVNRHPPSPYRFKNTVLRFEVPGASWITRYIPDSRFFKTMRESNTWQRIQRISAALRTWSRSTIWGDRLFLRFHGPTTLLLQTRASRVADVLSAREVNEIADIEPGALTAKESLGGQTPQDREAAGQGKSAFDRNPTMSFATIDHSTGKVNIETKKPDPRELQKEEREARP